MSLPLRPGTTFPVRTTPSLLALLFLLQSAVFAADFRNVTCEGTYPHHLQGVCTNERDGLF